MSAALTDGQLVALLQRYLTILQGHPVAEAMMDELLDRGETGGQIEAHTRLHFFLRSWKPPSPTSEEFTGACFHTWRVREADGDWRVAAQLVERFDDLNENSRRLFATPEEGLNR